MTKKFKLTAKQAEAQKILATPATHQMLFGGSRSGKTFLHVRNTVLRALKAPNSRHVALRFRFNHIKSAIIMDTFPKVMELAFPKIDYTLSKTDWVAKFPNDSELWFGGLDDKERTEKILGNEYVTVFLNECSQISWAARNTVLTRLAQKAETDIVGQAQAKELRPRMYYDCNPPNKNHWTYQLFIKHLDPETRIPLRSPERYVNFQMNPRDNMENLSSAYLEELEGMSERMKKRFLYGEFADANPHALFTEENFDKHRRYKDETLPDMLRIVVSVDPSGSGDVENADNDAIGIIVVGLGVDGEGYVLQDCTVKAGPATWGRVAASAYERHMADVAVGETNFGGAMVEHVLRTAKPNISYKMVRASRGKVARAEPISSLYDQGKIHHVGALPELEEELLGFSTQGFVGAQSPNRADALIWGLSELFPGLVQERGEPQIIKFRGWG